MEAINMEAIKKMMAVLQAKKDEVSQAERPVYITGGQFRYTEKISESIDLLTVKDPRKLVEIYTFLKERGNKYQEAAIELGVDVKFTWLGFTVEEWLKDLKTKVNVIQIHKRREELLELETRINAIIPQDVRNQLEFEDLQKSLSLLS